LSNIRVLVVDDSHDMREFVIQYVLEPNGFDAEEASDGAEGVRKALKGDIDLVLLDLEMPKMNGFEVLDALSARRLEIPVILMTSHGSEAIAVEVFRKGVRDYVIKPFTTEEMLETIERSLVEVRLQREKETLTARLMQTNHQLEQRLSELNMFYQIGKSVTSLMEPDQLLERIVDAALYVTGAEGGALLLQETGEARLRECVRKRRAGGQERQTSHRSEDQLAADAVRKGDVTMTAAMLCAPLKVGERKIGALGVSNKVTGRFFSDHDRRLLMALADYAAIAIENTRLLRQVEEAKEREKKQTHELFERHVSPNVGEKLAAQPEAVNLGGVCQQASVLFADVRGLGDFAQASPEVLVDVLNQHIGVAVEAILAEEGILGKILGDGVMAYFSTPLPQSDHVLRAVRAAWRLCRAVEEFHSEFPEASQFQFGVGVDTGEVIVGNIGVPGAMSFAVVGDAVNASRRLQEQARGGQVLLTQQAYGLVQDYVRAELVGMVEFKGHSQPEPIFEVVAVQEVGATSHTARAFLHAQHI
jgi:class 3 adenylate cyclase/DNA-binding response OmpR family regulator